jgi:hypothetical protein
LHVASLEYKPSFLKAAHLEGWAATGLVLDCDPHDMCLGLQTAHHRDDRDLPVPDPVIKLLSDIANAFCL